MSDGAAKKLIDDALSQHRIVVFSKSRCPYCRKAKQALLQIVDQAKLYILEIENRSDMDDIQNELASRTGARSVPRVFIDGAFIGGGDETAAMAKSGELQKMLEEKGIV